MPPSLPLRSLKLRLLFPYALLIALLTGVIGSITYLAGSRAVTALADRTLEQMAARLHQTIEHHVGGSAVVLEAAVPSGMAVSSDIGNDWHTLRRQLWAATTLHAENHHVYYGNRAGQSAGMKRLPDGSAVVRIRRNEHVHRDFYALQSIDARGRYLGTESSLFDPRERPWFQLASQSDQHAWTSVYIDFSLQDLVMTRARRVLNAHGEFEGVVATDISLTDLRHVVDEMGRNIEGYAFVVEPDGDLVAASNMKNIRLSATGDIERVSVNNSDNAMFAQIYQQLRSHFQHADPQSGKVHNMHLLAPDGSPLHAAFVRVRDAAGLDWIAAVAVPRATILADVSQVVIWVLVAGGLTFLLALVIGARLFGRAANDVRELALAVQRVGQGEITAEFVTRRTDEVGELARTFSQMRRDLFTDKLTGIANRSALKHILARMTTAPAPGVILSPFALLFIDLNWFKALNDRWGHDNGDRALMEIAQRFQGHIRQTDHVARLGGDEFVVVLRDITSREEAQTVSDQLTQLISIPLTMLQDVPEHELLHVGASIGIALYPQDASNAQHLLHLADQHMYANKATQHVASPL